MTHSCLEHVLINIVPARTDLKACPRKISAPSGAHYNCAGLGHSTMLSGPMTRGSKGHLRPFYGLRAVDVWAAALILAQYTLAARSSDLAIFRLVEL